MSIHPGKSLKSLVAGLVVAAGLLAMTPAFAELKTIEADGLYIVGDGTDENPAVAKERARDDAKRAASEKASVYVSSFSEAKNGIITKDIIRTISSNVLQVQKSDVIIEVEEGSALVFRCHIVAIVDSDRVTMALRQDGQELLEATRRNNELEAEIEKMNEELAGLKERYKRVTDEAEKEKILMEVKANEQRFEASRLVERGNTLMRDGDFTGAIGAYREALAMNKDDAIASYRLGDAYRMQKDYARAAMSYERAIEINPRYADAYNNLGFTYEELKNHSAAAENYKKATECDAAYANAYFNLGNSYLRDEDYKNAIDCYERAVSIDSRYTRAYNNLGLVYEKLGDYEKAVATFTKAIENAAGEDSALSRAYNNRGASYQMMRRLDEAMRDYEKAIVLDPNYADPVENLKRLQKYTKSQNPSLMRTSYPV